MLGAVCALPRASPGAARAAPRELAAADAHEYGIGSNPGANVAAEGAGEAEEDD